MSKPKSIVERVAAAIADIPGDPSSLVIARVAIEEYQRALFPPAFDQYALAPDLRRQRASTLAGFIVHIIGAHSPISQKSYEELALALFESGADIVTDADRRRAGLPERNEFGLTVAEMMVLESARLAMMRAPMIVPKEFPNE